MINVDGVIYGNFRCDIVGYDLNRCWKNPSPFIHPHIYKIKELLADLSEASSLDYCFDMHTHSKELGIFAYCCHEDSRAMPLLLSKMTSLFRYRSCTFGISKDKKQTARAALFEMTKNANIVTV
jgi:cytosolic carboxypeptidase protein 2/3